ncbi:MAG: hypothetical protein ACK56W_11000 [Pirellula sp.]|jgi:hypothetical protein|nr:hypothetical protein [Pirellula sp.]
MKRPQFNSRSLLSIVMLLIALVGSKGFAQPSGGEIGGAGGGIPNNNPVFAVVDFDDSGDIVGA